MSETWLTRHDWCTRQSWRSPTGMSFWPAGRMIEPARVIVVHSTETVGFPGYRNGADAPHFTIHLPSGQVRQHVPLEWGSRCLAVSTGGVTDRTVNITGTIQIEVIGAVTPGYPRTYGHYDLPNRFPTDAAAQAHLARLIRAIHDATGQRIPLQLSGLATWVPYPASYGVRARQRLNSASFRAARGVVGHQHAVANDHGDGLLGRAVSGRAIDMEAVILAARGQAPAPAPGDVAAPKGSTWEVTTAALNARSGPGTQHEVVGSATRGVVLTATGRVSGQWIEAQTPWQREAGVRAWWHSGFLTRTTAAPTPKPNETDRAAQQLLHDLGFDLGKHGVDGFWGPNSALAAQLYGTLYGFTGSYTTTRTALLNHLEETMNSLDELRQAVIDRTTVTLREPTAHMIGAEPGRKIPLEQAVDLILRTASYAWVDAREAKAHAAASEAALESLAGQTGGVDVEAVKEAARKGASDALAQVRFETTAASVVNLDEEEG